jgi:nitroreductase
MGICKWRRRLGRSNNCHNCQNRRNCQNFLERAPRDFSAFGAYSNHGNFGNSRSACERIVAVRLGENGMANAGEKPLSQAILERRATPSFEPGPVHAADLEKIIRAGLEAPSGYNLQPWRFVVIRDGEQKKKLRDAAFGQPKVAEASVVIVACGDPQGWKNGDLEEMLRLAAENAYGGRQDHDGVRQRVTGFLGSPAGTAGGVAPTFDLWVNRHVMIALTTMMWMAEVLGYDTAPMEGFEEDKLKALLHIPQQIRVVALLAIGRRKGDDKPYGGRFDPSHTVFAEEWGRKIEL